MMWPSPGPGHANYAGGGGLASFSDNFNRADGGLGANWTTDSAFVAPTIVSNTCKGGTASVHNVAIYSASGSIAANQFGQFTIAVESGGTVGVVLRSDGAGTFYTFYITSGGGGPPTIYKWIAGSATSLGSGTGGSVPVTTAGDVLYFEAVGTTLTVKHNGTAYATLTDSSITGGGYVGIDIYNNTGAIDTFSGGEL